jgi:hypothetical protein
MSALRDWNTYMLAFSPSTPPTNFGKHPPLAHRSKHEPVLCTPMTKAVSREVTKYAGAGCGLVDPFLYGIMRDRLTGVHNAIGTHCGENEVLGLKCTPVVKEFEPFEPD